MSSETTFSKGRVTVTCRLKSADILGLASWECALEVSPASTPLPYSWGSVSPGAKEESESINFSALSSHSITTKLLLCSHMGLVRCVVVDVI